MAVAVEGVGDQVERLKAGQLVEGSRGYTADGREGSECWNDNNNVNN